MSNGTSPARDALDDKANHLFAGKVVRKDLVRKVKVGANVPVFVLEFLLGKYCASSDEVAIKMGLQVVNDTLATEVPGVYAFGECAEHQGKLYGIVAPVWEQAAVLADVLTGKHALARYRGSKLYTRLKVAGVDVASMGSLEPELETDQVVQIIEERQGQKIGCIEEIAWEEGYITTTQLQALAEPLKKSGYGQYLMALT